MAVSDVVPQQDGALGNVKLHPYLVTLVRWCVSRLWSTCGALLQRLLAAPLHRLPMITAAKPPPRVVKPRAASSEHLHPEPRVECAVLHAPPSAAHTLDVVFVHGLYGSLGNTWRQGEWRTKYKLDPTKVPLRDHSTEPCGCTRTQRRRTSQDVTQLYQYDTSIDENVTFERLNGCFQKILPNENSLITEQFYNNTLLDVNNYETQAHFVSELFKNDCDTTCDNTFNCDGFQCSYDDRCECEVAEVCACVSRGGCAAGCGCVCDACYSECWPRDWIREDFPGARVISINYTSDPYLWRPLWVKGTQRLRLHERAEQMMSQLLALDVGQRPLVWVGHSKGGLFIKQIYCQGNTSIQMMSQLLALDVGQRPLVWVGHSKGGLFIKQIYCQAYEAHLKINKSDVQHQSIINNNYENQSDREYNINNKVSASVDNMYSRYNDSDAVHTNKDQTDGNCTDLLNNFIKEHNSANCATHGTKLRSIDEMNEIRNNNNSGNSSFNDEEENNNIDLDINYNMEQDDNQMYGCMQDGDLLDNKQMRFNEDSEYIDISVRKDEQYRNTEDYDATREDREVLSSNNEEDRVVLSARASLWSHSAGFMFYSVPHRGSPLADIKTPLTARSVELQEIAKDCPLVLELQRGWLAAARAGGPLVRSLVETTRTLMAVLWLRIVSEDSADAGVGVLHGVSVDHREICKPSSRRCLLYTELTHLIQAALHRCRCQ